MMKSSTSEPTVSKYSIVTITKDQVSTDLAGEMVILNLTSGRYYGLNEVGARIWELIQSPRSVNEILTLLLAEYEVKLDQCEHELLTLLQQLVAEGLIEIKNEAAS